MKARFWSSLLIVIVIGVMVAAPCVEAQRRRGQRPQLGKVCGDPTVRCPGIGTVFKEYDLPFHIPKKAVIWESEDFYGIVLKSVRAKENCDVFVSEEDRLAAQALFPRNKVFTDRCPEPGTLYYSKTNSDYRFMAVFAGRTRAEAERLLAQVRATGRYPGANIRRMRTGFNGT
jgi:hypothetical protein